MPVSFYIDDVFVGRVETTRALLPGASEVVEYRWVDVVPDTTYQFTAVINDPDHEPLVGLNECRVENNGTDPIAVACTLII